MPSGTNWNSALHREARPFGFGGGGSNALAVGRDLSQTGKGLLLGNPHRGWSGPGGFQQLHLTIPGEYDVAGAALHGVPWVGIGFNGDLAWTHTTSFAARFTLYELQLNPDDPLQYRYEDEWRDITTGEATIQVKLDDGSLEERSHTFYLSHYGPIVGLGEITELLGGWPLPNGNLLTLRDANALRDTRAVKQYLAMGRARTVAEFTEALKGIGIPVFHTFAADRDGEAFYGEVAGVPHVTQQQLDDCSTAIGRLLASGTNNAVLTLDGARAACEWGEDADSPPGSNLYGYEARPKLQTTDYVGNGNDSYWLSNADNPLTGFPVVFGWLGYENTQQSLRTRIGHLMVRERRDATDGLDDAGGFTLESMKALMYSNRVYGAEIVLDDVLAICAGLTGGERGEERAGRACAALADWDRKVDPESRGAQVFTEFWRGIHRELGNDFNLLIESASFWAVDFDPADPLNTPRGIDRSQTRQPGTRGGGAEQRGAGAGGSRSRTRCPLARGAVRHPQRRAHSRARRRPGSRRLRRDIRPPERGRVYAPLRQHLHPGGYLERYLPHRGRHPGPVPVERPRITPLRGSDRTVQPQGMGALSVLRGRDRGGADRGDGGGRGVAGPQIGKALAIPGLFTADRINAAYPGLKGSKLEIASRMENAPATSGSLSDLSVGKT